MNIPLTDTQRDLFILVVMINGMGLFIGAYLYFKAFIEMKRTKIIGWLGGFMVTGAACSITVSLLTVFNSPFLPTALVLERFLLTIGVIGFIMVSLDPKQGGVVK